MSDEEPPVPEEVLTGAKDQLNEEEISLADNEEILHALSELTPVYENDRSYFVLGNYDRGADPPVEPRDRPTQPPAGRLRLPDGRHPRRVGQ